MTDKEAAFSLLCSMPDSAEAKEAVEVFLAEAKGPPALRAAACWLAS